MVWCWRVVHKPSQKELRCRSRNRRRDRREGQGLQPDLVRGGSPEHALRLEIYIQDATRDGDSELADLFREAQADSRVTG
jgi:hypothetical protein